MYGTFRVSTFGEHTMNSLAALVVLVGVAVAAPQAAYRAPFKPLAAPYKAAAYPYAAPGYPYAAAPVYPYAAAPAYPFAAPAYAAKPAPYVAPAAKPYAAPYNPQYPTQYVAIVRQSQDDNFDGSFNYDFQAENGIASQASGFVKNAGSEAESQVIQGSYSYTAPDGTPIVTTYIADENGFQVQGDHLPVAPAEPELPPLIAKSIAYQASLPPAPETAPARFAPAYYKRQ